MTYLHVFFGTIAALFIAACSSTQPETLAINGLQQFEPNLGSFQGLEDQATSLSDGRQKVTVLYSYGIGWTQEKENLPNDFGNPYEELYGVTC
mgnify:CR=1 FL=1